MRLVGIAERDAQDLEVEAVLVAHLEPADRPAPDVAAGERRLVDDQERVGVVTVGGARLLDEAVVEVVEDGRGQDPVQPEDAGLLVVLVLVPAPARDLDDDLDGVREVGAMLGGHARTMRQRGSARSPADGHQPATDGSGGVSARRSRAPQRAHSDVRERGAQATTRRWRRISRRSVVVEALLDQLLLHACARSDRSRRTRSASRTRGPRCPGRRGSSRPRRRPSRGSAAPGTG